MFFDRLEMLAVITFLGAAIPTGSNTGKNCLFIRIDGGNLILTTGDEFVTKKVIMTRPNTVEESADDKPLPKTFMIPRAALFSFKEMMKEHKADCKKLAKDDPSYLFIEIDDKELVSYDEKIVYEQPKYTFKDLETIFQITKEHVSEIPMISADVISAMTGFSKSESVEVTFTGPKSPIHFQQGDYEAIVLPPVEKVEENDQDHGKGQTTTT